jgi:hypothetical protein
MIPIELSENGFMGTVREDGQPDLVAHRPEAWRFMRLARVVGAAKAIAQQELGSEASLSIVEAMIWISDLKGDFTVCWHPTRHRPEYNAILTRALATERETDIEFQMGDDA